jgi:catechol 2,3-dioxygenase-like lactoylglutathione lyase family enzyme
MLKKIHHIGIVVRNLEEAFKFYKDTLGLPLGKMATVQDQGVKAALLPVGESEIELLEPITPDTGVAKFLEKKGGKIYLNEVNTIPGFTSISMYPKLWEASGIPFRELIDKLIDFALEQHAEKSRTKYQIELPEGAGGALEG